MPRTAPLSAVIAVTSVAAALAVPAATPAAAATAPPIAWQKDLGGPVRESSPLLVDLDGDGTQDVVVGAHDAKVYGLSGASGNAAPGWPKSVTHNIQSSPAAGDATGDGQPEIYVGAGTAEAVGGALYSFDRNGTQRFRTVLADRVFPSPSVFATPAVGDITGDGANDVASASLGLESLWAFNAWSGSAHPGYPHYWDDTIFSSPALADVNGDGKLDVIVGGDSSPGAPVDHQGGMVKAVSGTGQVLWEYRINDIVRSSPSVGDVDGDGKAEVVFGAGDFWGGSDSTYVFCLDAATGTLQWKRGTDGVTNGSPALTDVNGDGRLEVAIGTFNSSHGKGNGGSVYVLDGRNGNDMSGFPVASGGGVVLAGITTADLDGDGGQDLLVPTGGLIAAFDGSSGARLYNLAEGLSTGFQSSVAVGDLDNDGRVDLVAAGTRVPSTGVVLRWELDATARLGNGGWHHFRFNAARTGSAMAAPTPRQPLPIERVSGADRYATAAALSERAGGSPTVVYVASGTTFPDALAGGPAAHKVGATLLLTNPTSLPSATRTRITALNPDRIVVLGGTGAVSDAVLAELNGLARSGATRISGTDRYDTAARISAQAFSPGVPVVYLVTGQNFPDALSAANAAAVEGGPVLLTSSTSLSPAASAELARLAPSTVVMVGGTSSVSAAVESAVRAQFTGTIVRLSGADRYATAVAVSQRVFANGATKPYLATGTSFPDALAGGPVAAKLGSPLLLVQGTCSPASVTTEIERLGATTLVLLGGTAVLSNSLATLPAC